MYIASLLLVSVKAQQCASPSNWPPEDCGRVGTDQSECEYQGCVWCPNAPNGWPWCQSPPKVNPQCQVGSSVEDCGHSTINQNECVSKGCVWCTDAPSPTPWCQFVKLSACDGDLMDNEDYLKCDSFASEDFYECILLCDSNDSMCVSTCGRIFAAQLENCPCKSRFKISLDFSRKFSLLRTLVSLVVQMVALAQSITVMQLLRLKSRPLPWNLAQAILMTFLLPSEQKELDREETNQINFWIEDNFNKFDAKISLKYLSATPLSILH